MRFTRGGTRGGGSTKNISSCANFGASCARVYSMANCFFSSVRSTRAARCLRSALAAAAMEEDGADQFARQRLQSLQPLVEKLNASLSCSICLQLMQHAHQLQCSHMFCVACVHKLLAMSDARCAICKHNTAKRMLSPLISFSEATQTLRALQHIVRECVVESSHPRRLRDGFDHALGAAMLRMRHVQRQHHMRVQRLLQQSPHVQTNAAPPNNCVLCPKGVDASFFSPRVRFGALKALHAPLRGVRAFAHENCALYASGVYLLDERVQRAQQALITHSSVLCERRACGRTRATVACTAPSCTRRYHYACALLDACVFVEDGYRMFCAQHASLAPRIDHKQFDDALCHARGALSLAHDDCCFVCGSGGRLLMCDGCERCAHAACCGLRSLPQGAWNCAVCTPNASSRGGDGADARGRKRARVERSTQLAHAKRAREKALPNNNNNNNKRMVLAHTGLKEAERELLRGVARAKNTLLREDVDAKVTHVVIRCERGSHKPLRTMKLCKAIASAARIVCWSWVQQSLHSEQWAPIERHVHPLSWATHRQPVFANLRFSFACYNGARDKKLQLMQLAQMGGATVVQRDGASPHSADAALIYVREEQHVNKSARSEQLRRLQPPRAATVVMSAWLLDLCTNNRTPANE
eukprot:TRINITY_DN1781_c0_g1_i1.p1 TRINITY_DN1781_c0_g1~~TRINITY_DN1781_c0_g1_i1.p1  ORF type:complete len:643 (+),score=159.47 TRINITY_DN1781_c0_g1_i1:3986-5914(+)